MSGDAISLLDSVAYAGICAVAGSGAKSGSLRKWPRNLQSGPAEQPESAEVAVSIHKNNLEDWRDG